MSADLEQLFAATDAFALATDESYADLLKAQVDAESASSVITSYSIHYTKLYDSVIQALKALDRTHVALVVVDAEEGITDQDLTIAGYAHERGRAIVIVVNKWDLVTKDTHTMNEYTKEVRRQFRFVITSYSIHYTKLYDQDAKRQ